MDIRPGSTGCRTSLERVLLLYRDNCSGGSCAGVVEEEKEVEEEDEAIADEDDDRLRCRLSCLDDGVENRV
jgi:hypothetical protein